MNDTAHPVFDVFLSHSHVDAEPVETLGEYLEDKATFRVWLDKWILVPGKHWQQEMAKGLDQAKTCAVCIGQETPRGWFKEEIERALNRQTKDDAFRVIPVILPGGDKTVIDEFLELRTWVHFSQGFDDGNALYLLSCGIKGISPGRGQTAKSVAPELNEIREHLAHLRALRQEGLIDDPVAVDFQRQLVEKMIAH
jgi:hypothetical protein